MKTKLRISKFAIETLSQIKNMDKKRLTFDDMPSILSNIIDKLITIEDKVNQLTSSTEIVEEWLSLKELCDYLPSHPAEQTVYGWTSSHFIPFYKKGKNLIFLKSEIDHWLKNSHHKSLTDLENEAKEFINNKKKKNDNYI